MRSLRPWIAGYLVLCLALAGAVGLSPFLHQVIEHGGHGAWHTHAHTHLHAGAGKGQDLKFIPDHAEALPELAPIAAGLETKSRPIFPRNHRPFKLPTASFVKLVGAAADLLGGPARSSTPEDQPAEDHEHHSLAQLLANGLLDQHVEIPVLPHFIPVGAYHLLSPDELLLASIWNAQTPDRGPPAFVG